MGAMASQITRLTIVYSTVYSGADQRKHQTSASLAFVRGIHRWPVKSVFDTLYNLNTQGFQTWISKTYELKLVIWYWYRFMSPANTWSIKTWRMKSYFVSTWPSDLRSGDTSIVRTYRLYKSSFGTECYLKSISNPKLRVALSKFTTSSHDLEIEHGRYVRRKLNVDERLCLSCNVVENEEYFVTACKDNEVERALFTNKLKKKIPIICQFNK